MKSEVRPKCYYCERELGGILRITIDHVVPKSRGGKNNSANTVYCCDTCNRHKGSKSLGEWELFVSKHSISGRSENFSHRIPTMLKNIRKHPLYSPFVVVNSFRQFRDYDKTVYMELKPNQDPYNFHEEYVKYFTD